MSTLQTQLSQPYPASWTVTRALDTYLAENGFTKDEYDKKVIELTFWWFTFPFPNPPSRHMAIRLHDLHHVVTGYGTDPTGEGEISAFELRRGIGVFSLFVQGIVFFGTLLGFAHSPRRTLAAWRAAHTPEGIGLQPATPERYAELMQLTVGELRTVFGVPQAGLTGARQLHYGAPSRQANAASSD